MLRNMMRGKTLGKGWCLSAQRNTPRRPVGPPDFSADGFVYVLQTRVHQIQMYVASHDHVQLALRIL
jgi:hypothetical protein